MMINWSIVSVVLSVLLLTRQTQAVPVKTLQKVSDRDNSPQKVGGGESEEPFYAYIYEYEDDGGQIWSDCSQDQSVMKIKSIQLYPNPPQKGEAITASVKAELFEQVDGGSVTVLIKYRGIITVINKVFQICDLAQSVQKSCPIEEGDHQIEVTETFPSYALSGTYVGVVTAMDGNGKKIACVSLDISIS